MNAGGRIIMIGSAMGERVVVPGFVSYAATKGAVKIFTQSLSSWEPGHHGQQRAAVCRGSKVAALERRIRVLQERVGYTGDYDSWIAGVTPFRSRRSDELPDRHRAEAYPPEFTVFGCI